MKIEYRYNVNYACLMRGTEEDVPSQTVTFNSTSEKNAVKKILKTVWDEYDVADFNDTFEDETDRYTFENLTQWASEMDIGGGSPILFYVEVDGKVYEANDESDFDFDDEDDEDDEDEDDEDDEDEEDEDDEDEDDEDDEDEDDDKDDDPFYSKYYPEQFAELQKILKTSVLCKCLGAYIDARYIDYMRPCIGINLPISKENTMEYLIYSFGIDFGYVNIYTEDFGNHFYDIRVDEVDKYLIKILKKYNPSAAKYYSNKVKRGKEESTVYSRECKKSLRESEVDLLNLAQFASLAEIGTVLEVYYEGRPCGTIKTSPFGKHDFSKLYMFNGTDNETGVEAWNFYKTKSVDFIEAVGKKFIYVHLK